MKRLIALLSIFVLLLAGCAKQQYEISYNDDYTEIYYNGRTYVQIPNSDGKYNVDMEACEQLDSESYMLIAKTLYFGNDKDNPDFITENRAHTFFVREDLSIDNSTTLTAQKDGVPFSFTIDEVTTGEVVPYSIDEYGDYAELFKFTATVEPYSQVTMKISIMKRDGVYYLQDCWDSDYYLIPEEFLEQLTQAFQN